MRMAAKMAAALTITGCTATALGTAAEVRSAGSLSVLSPVTGQTVTTTDIPVRLAVRDFKLQTADMGKPSVAGQGHIHVMIDKMDMEHMAEIFVTDRFTIPGDGLAPGPHTLLVELAGDDHRALSKPVEVKIDYRPTKLESLPQALAAGKPAIRIMSPPDGATVPRRWAAAFTRTWT